PKDSLMININEISKEHKPTIAYNISDIIKGYHIFLKVLLRSSDNTRFITFGSAIPAIIKNRKKNILHYSRRLSHEEVIKIYMRSWAALSLSIVEETFGYAVLDAGLATAIPIAFKVGGISEIIEGTHAESFSVKPYDISSLLDKIEYISSMSPHQVMDIGIKIRSELLRKFDEKKIESSLIEIFNTILSE
ncbi:MAG: glycosyltransferase, partial [Thermoprotei archaeon]